MEKSIIDFENPKLVLSYYTRETENLVLKQGITKLYIESYV